MNVEPYDFTKPGRLSPDWQLRLRAWFRLALELANKAWSKQLPFQVQASLVDLDGCYAKRGLAKLTEATVAYPITADNARLTTLMTVPRLTMHKLIGTMLGDTESTSADREFTLIEENLAEYFFVHYWLPYFRETWPTNTPPKWVLSAREADTQRPKTFAADDVLVEFHWQLRGPWGDSKATWYCSRNTLLEALGASPTLANPSQPAAEVTARRDAVVEALPLVLEVVVGTAELRLSQLSALKVGDVVLLDRASSDGVVARINGSDLFHGQPGRLGSARAFQVDALSEKVP